MSSEEKNREFLLRKSSAGRLNLHECNVHK